MRLQQPRIASVSEAEMQPDHRAALKNFGPAPIFNILRTLARAPKALTRFNCCGVQLDDGLELDPDLKG